MGLLDLLNSDRETIFLDGAMGTQLGQAGLEMGGKSNVTHPEAVLAVHEEYADSGIDLLITNTLTMNRINLESHNVGVDTLQANAAGVRLAKQAARDGQYVLGDISSTGKMMQPYGQLSEDEASAAFKEQADILADAGVDGFIIETMFDLREALCALRAAREVGDLPIIVSISFSTAGNGGRTVMGDTALDCARSLSEAGASVGRRELRQCRSSRDGRDRVDHEAGDLAAHRRPTQCRQGTHGGQESGVRHVAGRFCCGCQRMWASGRTPPGRLLRDFACSYPGDGPIARGCAFLSTTGPAPRPGRGLQGFGEEYRSVRTGTHTRRIEHLFE